MEFKISHLPGLLGFMLWIRVMIGVRDGVAA
jgi:hypothetical protein